MVYESRLALTVDSRTGERSLKSMRGELGKTEKAGGLASAAMGKLTVAINLAAAAAGGFSYSRIIKETTAFDTSMRSLQATSRATAEQIAALEKQARTLGATTMFSAKQAADAQQFLAMAGFQLNEIMEATPKVMKLATAANIDLAQAADISSNVLGGMGLAVSELDRVLDVMISTTTGSNTNIIQLGEALSYAAPIAAAAGISIEEVSAAIGALGDAGIQAGRAGTGVVGIIRQLSKVTPAAQVALQKYGISLSDVDITTRGLIPVLETLNGASLSTADSFEVFGSLAGVAGEILSSNAVKVGEFAEKLKDVKGAADEAADIIGGGLAGSWASFNSALSESMIRLGRDEGFAGGLQSVAFAATGLLSVYNDMLPAFAEANNLTEEQADEFERLALGIEAAASGLLAAGAAYGVITVATRGATVAQMAFNAAARVNPYVAIITTIAAASAALYTFAQAQQSAVDVWEKAKESDAAYQAAMGNVTAQNRINEIVKERMKLEAENQKLRDKGFKKYSGRANTVNANERKLAALAAEYNQITDARIEATKAYNERRAKADAEEEAARNKMLALAREQEEAERRLAEQASNMAWNNIVDKLDPVGAEVRQIMREMEQDIITVQERLALGLISKSDADKAIKDLRSLADKTAAEAGKKAGDKFTTGFEAQTRSIANSLQDAITQGNWAGVGATVGGALAGGIAGAVTSKMAGAMGESIAASIAAPMFGALVGGLAGLAFNKIGSMFRDDYDPAAERQAAQGAGTVLGDINAKTQSISKSVAVSASATSELVGINRGMLEALRSTQAGIKGASGRVASEMDFLNMQMPSFDQNLFNKNFATKMVGESFNAMGSLVTLGLFNGLGDALGKALGGKTKEIDRGIRLGGGSLTALMQNANADAYLGYKTKSWAGGSYSHKEQSERLTTDVQRQFQGVYKDIYKSVGEGLDVFGMDIAELAKGFVVDTTEISFKGMGAEEKTKALESHFSKVFDDLTKHTLSWSSEFQLAGEGQAETLTRIATNMQVTREAADQLGFSFGRLSGVAMVEASEQLIELSGGMENFISGMKGFVSNFASEARQFEIAQGELNSAFEQTNMRLPKTREGYFDLMEAQDASTESGAKNIAALLRLQGAADSYYSSLEEQARKAEQERIEQEKKATQSRIEQAKEEADAHISLLREQASAQSKLLQSNIAMTRSALSVAQAAASAVDNALLGLQGTESGSKLRRDSALTMLQQMASSGKIGDNLGGALTAATNINMNEFSSFDDYIREVARTGAVLTDLKQVTDKQVSREEALLQSIEKRLEAMQRDSNDRQAAIAKNTASTVTLLTRQEVGANA